MTRTDKWKDKRYLIELENCFFKDTPIYKYIKKHQIEIKKKKGCKH